MATTVYSILDSRDKTELTNKINSDKTELTQSIQSTKTELQGNIDALEEKHDEDKTTLQNNINKKADKTELTSHNTSGTAHNDIRLLIQELTTRLNSLADSDDETLDQMSEIVAYIEDNRDLIESITTSKVSVSDIINNVTTNVANKPLSAAMGVHLKGLIDAIPTDTLSTVNEKIAEHNVSGEAHEDIRTDVLSAMSEATTAKANAATAQAAADAAQEDVDDALSRLNSLEVGSGKLDRIVSGDGIVTCEDSLVDASPVEMVVYGNTVQNLWVNPSGTQNGVTVTANIDGSITLSGTTTKGMSVRVQTYVLKPNTKYTASVDKAVSGSTDGSISFFVGNGSQNNHFGYAGATTITFTTGEPNKAGAFVCGFWMSSAAVGTTVSGTYRVMLNEGSTAEPWCPPGLNSVGDGGSVDIVTVGKNLVPSNFVDIQYRANKSAWAVADPIYYLPGKTVTASFYRDGVKVSGTSDCAIYLINSKDSSDIAFSATPARPTAVIGQAVENMVAQVFYNNLFSETDCKVSVQLELGSTATDYEPPNIATTPIDLQGHTLNALPDGTRDELHIDGGGNVVLEKRCGVATAPESPSSWIVESVDKRARFRLSDPSSIIDGVQKSKLWCDKLPVRNGIFDSSRIEAYVFEDKAYVQSPQHETASEIASAFGGAKYIYPLREPQTIYLGTIDLPALPSSNSHIWIADDVASSLSVRYWLPNGELVADLYESGATDEMSDAEIMAIWNGATGDIVAATNVDIDAMFD